MGNRGRERQVNCEKCGRTVRKDKAVFIEKPILQNPLERHQLAEPSTYRAVLTREVAYCPGCGKHLRVYEKKIKQNIRNDERAARQSEFGDRRFPSHRHFDRPRDVQGDSQGSQGGHAGSQASGQSSSQGEAAKSNEASSSEGTADAADASSTEAKVEESEEAESEESEVPSENEQSKQGGASGLQQA